MYLDLGDGSHLLAPTLSMSWGALNHGFDLAVTFVGFIRRREPNIEAFAHSTADQQVVDEWTLRTGSMRPVYNSTCPVSVRRNVVRSKQFRDIVLKFLMIKP